MKRLPICLKQHIVQKLSLKKNKEEEGKNKCKLCQENKTERCELTILHEINKIMQNIKKD